MEQRPDSSFVQQIAMAIATEPGISSTPATSYTSPFKNNIARAFHVPSPEDVQVITAGLERPERERLDLEREIAQMTVRLYALKLRHSCLLRHTTQSYAYIAPSPIRQLPTEILQLIFIEACTSRERREYEMPLNISWVCWKWREIALATPSLWTNIYFGGHKWYQPFIVYARRSAGLPLSVKIKVPYQRRPAESDAGEWDRHEETYEYHIMIMEEVFLATFRRWRDVELHMGIEDLEMLHDVTDLYWSEDGPLEWLESVTLGIEEHHIVEREYLPTIFHEEYTPSLRSIDFVERTLF